MLRMTACLALLAAAAAAAAAAVAPQARAQSQDVMDLENALDYGFDADETRMVGGDIVTDSTYSYVVAIQPKYTDINGATQKAKLCSGVLIEGSDATGAQTYYVLTSASCALSGTTYDMYAGLTKVTASTTVTDATQTSTSVIVTDEFRRTMATGDLAIIPTTITPSTTGTTTITTALLSNINDITRSYLVNTVAMAGWGYPNDVYLDNSPSLRQLSSWVVPNWYCAVRHLSMPIKTSHVCTAGLVNKGPCTGDSGAPLILKNSTSTRVIGLATHTPRDGCSRGKPGVFTRIGDFLGWISEQTGYNVEQ